jgi:multiple sugar transport system permease protein
VYAAILAGIMIPPRALMMTIPAGIGTVVSGVGIINARQMASAVLGALPLVFAFLLAQRQIVEGVAGTGLK